MNDQPTSAAATPEAPTPTPVSASLPEHTHNVLKIYTHSPILYWWPIWLLGFLFFILSGSGLADSDAPARVQGLTFVFTLLFVIFSTTVRLRGANSVIFGLILAIGGILLAMGNMFEPVAKLLGQMDITMSPTFYLFMGLALFLMWALMIFAFDKVKYYEIAPGQVRQRMFWGGGDRAESGSNARCQYRADDFLRHRMLGFVVTGDIEITLASGEVWYLHNVLFAKRKASQINDLIVTRPID